MAIGYTEIDFINSSAPALNATNLNKIDEALKDACDLLDAETVAGRALVEAADADAQRTALDVDSKAEVTAKSRDPASFAAAVAAMDATTDYSDTDRFPFSMQDGTAKFHIWSSIKAAIKIAIGYAAQSVGFTLSGGTTSKTLTVSADADTKDVPTADEKTRLGDIQAATGATTAAKLVTLVNPTATQTASRIPLYNAAKGINADGISFPATQAPSADANTLDDYEEGGWTVSLYGASTEGSPTYDRRVGWYTKKGREVTIGFVTKITSKGGVVGTLAFKTIPFAAANTSYLNHVNSLLIVAGVTLSAGYTTIKGQIASAGTTISLYKDGSGQSAALVSDTEIADTFWVAGEIIYHV
jgi:hypothetical protein